MDLNQITYFIEVVRSGSFSKAARALGIPKSTLSRKVLDLEERLGVVLLTRTTRRQVLTKAGEDYYAQGIKIISELSDLEKSISTSRVENSGLIRLTAPADADGVLAPLIAKFSKIHPHVEFEVRLTDRVVDLVGEGFDLAMRFGPLKNSSLKAKKIGMGGMRLFASREYLKQKGVPKHPKELHDHDCVLFALNKGDIVWSLSDGRARMNLKMNSKFRISSLMMCRRLVESGVGIGALPNFATRELGQNSTLTPVLTHFHFEQRPLYLVYPEQKYMPASLRSFIDFMVVEYPKSL